MCLRIVTFDPKTGKIKSDKRQCKRCMSEGRNCTRRQPNTSNERVKSSQSA